MIELLVALIFYSPTVLAETPSAGRVVSLKGVVLVRNESENAAQMRKLKPGDPIFSGDIINTSSVSSAKLLMADKSVIDINESTLFKVAEFKLKNVSDRKVDLEMNYGKVRASVNEKVGAGGKFQIHTKAASMGVRGTEFVVQSDLIAQSGEKTEEVKTELTVLHGNVEVTNTNQKPVIVSSNQQATMTATVQSEQVIKTSLTPPKIEELPATQTVQIIQAAKIPDQTFKQTVTIDRSISQNTPVSSAALVTLTSIQNFAPDQLQAQGQIFTPGTFAAQVVPAPVNVLPPTTPINVNVVFKQ